jgi:CubicO group peptidase (beta-lactamase class C family)
MRLRLCLVLVTLTGGCHTVTDIPTPDAGPGHTADTLDAGGGLTADQLQQLDALVEARMQTAQVPGAAVAVVKGGRVVLSRAWGFADVEQQKPATPDTLFQLASVSKTVTSVALMQLYDQHRFALDDDIDAQLPYPVRNPHFPSVPITYRMLLSHTSSIEDSNQVDAHTVTGDSPIALDTFLKGYLTAGGTYYDAANWSSTNQPGASYSYANAGMALAGDLVEILSGQNLQDYCQANLFAPLGMTQSSWFLAGLDPQEIAVPYTVDGNGKFVPGDHLGWPTYPDGQLRTSANQLARFLLAFIQFGQLDGVQILSQPTVMEMRKQQPHSNEGLSWGYWDDGNRSLIGHSGAYIGMSTDMYFDTATGGGFVLLTNANVYLDHTDGPEVQAMIDIDEALLGVSDRF